jgi:hypothetical protein
MLKRVHSVDEAKGSNKYGYTAKIFEGEAYCDLKIEVGLPLQNAQPLVLRNRSDGSMSAMISAHAYLIAPMSQAVGSYSRFCSMASVNDSQR